ncbi:hypothetical protein [Sphingomonas sp.]|uniref:hypothetical protein n=1 Tax=Sphingomonas sp. TaxID=28214 RepID=UPI001B0677A1|nr:hypothetical protein [Sphingomonas sp.]MBO9714028.1 hypothetical protein [Sphingomonas sp.]
MRRAPSLLLLALPLLSGGCVARAAWDVATLPVKAGAKAVDLATTSQEEADRNYGRRMRHAEEREARERAAHDKACRKRPEDCGPYTGFRAHPDRLDE